MTVKTCTTRGSSLYDSVIHQTGGPAIKTSSGPEVAFVDIDAINVPLRREHIDKANLVGLTQSIKGGWLRHPIVLTPEHLLLDGERRMWAAKQAGETHIRAHIVHTLEDASKVMAETLADTEFQVPASYTQICRTLDVLYEWTEPHRQQRRSEVARNTRSATGVPRGRSIKHTRDYIAAAVGVSGGSLERLRQIWRMTMSDDKVAANRGKEAMELINAGSSISTCLGLLKSGLPLTPHSAPVVVTKARTRTTLPRVEQITNPTEQRKVLVNVTRALGGINLGLAQVLQISDTALEGLDEAELEQVRDVLSTTRRLISVALRHINATDSE